MNIISQFYNNNSGVVICQSQRLTPKWIKAIPNLFLHENFTFDLLRNIRKLAHECIQSMDERPILILIDSQIIITPMFRYVCDLEFIRLYPNVHIVTLDLQKHSPSAQLFANYIWDLSRRFS